MSQTATLEHSQAYDSQASGGTEVGVLMLRRLFGSLELCLEARIGRKVPANHPMSRGVAGLASSVVVGIGSGMIF